MPSRPTRRRAGKMRRARYSMDDFGLARQQIGHFCQEVSSFGSFDIAQGVLGRVVAESICKTKRHDLGKREYNMQNATVAAQALRHERPETRAFLAKNADLLAQPRLGAWI